MRLEAALAPGSGSEAALFGVELHGQDGTLVRLQVDPGTRRARVLWRAHAGWQEEQLALPDELDLSRFQLLRAEVDGPRVRLSIAAGALTWRGVCAAPVHQVALHSAGRPAAFAGFALTAGYEDLFDDPGASAADLGWQPEGAGAAWQVAAGALRGSAGNSAILKPVAFEACDMVINARAGDAAPGAAYGIYPAAHPGRLGALLSIEPGAGGRWDALWHGDDAAHSRRVPLPASFDPRAYQQWRLRRQGGRVAVAWEQHEVGVFEVPSGPAGLALAAFGQAMFEMVRVTATRNREGREGHVGAIP
jgi:hypothetical protein